MLIPIVAWVLAGAAYLLFTGQTSADEVALAVGCGFAAMLWFAALRRVASVRFGFDRGAIAELRDPADLRRRDGACDRACHCRPRRGGGVTALLAGLFILTGLAGAGIVLSREPRTQVLAIAANGAVLTALFFALQAPDVALSELAVGTAASSASLPLRLPRPSPERRRLGTSSASMR